MYEFTRRRDGPLVKFMLGGHSWESALCSRSMLLLLYIRADHLSFTRPLPGYILSATLKLVVVLGCGLLGL